MIYLICKQVITSGAYSTKSEYKETLTTFKELGELTESQYDELLGLLNKG